MTGIEWTEKTWNPIVGCSITSPGCTNCYAMKMAARVEAMSKGRPNAYSGLTKRSKAGPVWTGDVRLVHDRLAEPLKTRKPTMFFVNSMGDLFHEDVPDEWIDQVFAVMALAPRHVFQVLTKRSQRMREYLTEYSRLRIADVALGIDRSALTATGPWPLPNVWLGVSVEDQARADERVPDLLATPTAVRWVSAEPLLEPLKISGYLWGRPQSSLCDDCPRTCDCECLALPRHKLGHPSLDWVVVGGESGPGARPMNPDWARSIRDQCAAAGVPFFMKQMGGPVKSRMPPIPEDLMIRQWPEERAQR